MKRDWTPYESARERPPGRVVMRQRWEHLLFLHWPVDPAVVAATLPPGLTVECYDGRAWLGVVPFWMRGVRPAGLPTVPGVSSFHELNLRTYVRDGAGRPGVWFYSLDCDQPLAVAAARLFFHLPYEHAAFASAWDGKTIQYACERRGRKGRAFFEYQPRGEPAPAAVGSFGFFLVERYRLFAWNARVRRLRSGRVWHEPYRISPVEISGDWAATFAWNGFAPPDGPPVHAAHCAGVQVEVFALR